MYVINEGQRSVGDVRHAEEAVLPKPSGCPPIRTILHSSPEELVKRRSAGNLEQRCQALMRQKILSGRIINNLRLFNDDVQLLAANVERSRTAAGS